MKKNILAAVIGTLLITPTAFAHQAGDWVGRAGLIGVFPNVKTDVLDLKVNNDYEVGLNLDYFITDNFAVELVAATPFEHKMSLKGGFGKLGNVHLLPPTLLGQYYFGNAQSKFRPYVGLGINYTHVFSYGLSQNAAEQGLSNLKMKDSWGLAGQVGVDYMINSKWLVNASAMYAQVETKVTVDVGGNQISDNVTLNPMVYMVSVGYKF